MAVAPEPSLIDMTLEDAPAFVNEDAKQSRARRFASGATRTPPKPKAPITPKVIPDYRAGMIKKGFEELYATIGAVLMLKDPTCGMAIIQAAPEVAESLEELARDNPTVRRILMGVIATNALGKVVVAHMPILMIVFAHHIAPRMNGDVDPELFVQMMSKGNANDGTTGP